MSTVNEMRERAKALRKQGQYAKAEKIFRELWEEHRVECDDWDGWGYAYCLRKLGRPDEALDICREIYKSNPDFDRNRNLYGWCIYDSEMGKTEEEIGKDPAKFFKAADAIVELTSQDQYSPYVRSVFKVVDYLKSRPSYPADRILEWLDKLELEDLSSDPGKGRDRDGSPIEYASDKEQWYAHRCKALYEGSRYEDCRRFGEQALGEIPEFHYDNDVWIKWRMALSKAEMGDKADAIYDLRELLKFRKEWFIQRDVARLLYEIDRPDAAIKYAVDSALNAGELSYKWEVFLLLGRIYQTRSELEKAKEHILLAAKLRQGEGWKLPPELRSAIEDLGIDVNTEVSTKELLQKLKETWYAVKLSDMPQGKGDIATYKGHYGFIRGDDGVDYYFKPRSFQGARKRLQPGLRVEFYIERNPDPDEGDIAIHISEIKA